MRVKPYNPVKPVNGVKIVKYQVGERIEIPVEIAFGGKIPAESTVRIQNAVYIVKSSNSTTITITPKIDAPASKAKHPAEVKNQYKDFYIKKMRNRR